MHRAFAMALCIAVLAGCLHEASRTCRDGSVCPPGLECVDTESTTADGRICVAGTCGNGRHDPDEKCEDGNNRSGDGCPADCTEPCGDGVRDPDEACDDGNTIDGDGCAADCRALDGISLVTPAMVSFAAIEGDPLPAAVTVTVRLQRRGDVVTVAHPPGPAPGWLSIVDGPTTTTTAAFDLRVTDTVPPGPRAARVRVTIHHTDLAAAEAFDLPVTYSVARSDLAITAAPPGLAFTTVEGDAVIPPQALVVTFNGEGVALVSAPSWLTVSAPGAMYPLSRTLLLPDIVNDYNAYAMAMTSTLDDGVVFISGAYRLLVVPVN